MDQKRADAIARAMLFPDPRQQVDQRARAERDARLMARQRRVAWMTLAGFAVGAIAAHLLGERFTVGGLWGGIVGGLLGQLLGARAAR